MNKGIFIDKELNNKKFYLIGYNKKTGKEMFCSSDKEGNVKFTEVKE